MTITPLRPDGGSPRDRGSVGPQRVVVAITGLLLASVSVDGGVARFADTVGVPVEVTSATLDAAVDGVEPGTVADLDAPARFNVPDPEAAVTDLDGITPDDEATSDPDNAAADPDEEMPAEEEPGDDPSDTDETDAPDEDDDTDLSGEPPATDPSDDTASPPTEVP